MSSQEKDIEVTIAVISDLHCHHSKKFSKLDAAQNSSFLLTDLPRVPIKNHPIESLIKELLQENIQASILLCPGDITHQVDVQGLISGWAFVKEVGTALKVSQDDIVATLGNHDIDSRYNLFDEVFHLVKTVGNGYPISDSTLMERFWAKGFCFLERAQSRILIFNSVYSHTNKDQTVQGKIEQWQLEQIEDSLKAFNDNKIQIALFHHHPLEHARFQLGTEDVIENGGELIDLLNKFKFDLIIHGHKHDPWLRYSQGGGLNQAPIFSAGSFSFRSAAMVTGSKNTFHLLKLRKKFNQKACGQIETWEYLPSNGWRRAESGDQYFPMYTGFGFTGNLNELVVKTINLISQGNGAFIHWSNFIKELEEVNYLTPDEIITFRNLLADQGVITNPELPKLPKIIGKPNIT